VGGACGTHGRGEESVQGFDGKGRGVDGIKTDLREIGGGGGHGVDSLGSG
jgi:hypothetical protein